MYLDECLNEIKSKINFSPKIALVLGSGLGDYADNINIKYTLDYNDIKNFPISTVKGHKGRFIFGYVQNIPIVIMQGRIHYYEGYSMENVVLPIRLMKMMGAEILILTNAAGGINSSFSAGDFMIIKDQISNFVPSPLIGKNIDELGTRFPDMSEIYNKELQNIIKNCAKDLDIPIKEGVYIQLTGPNYETPAEINMCRILGADAVGMSTACEAIVAKHMNMKICGISFISNLASGISNSPLSHEEVKNAADKASPQFKQLITKIIENLNTII